MTTQSTQGPPSRRAPSRKRPARSKSQTGDAAKLGIIAGAVASIEWYDFFIYGLAAALVFPQLFFPEMTPIVGLMLSFAAYGVGFVARPLGGIIFGHYGDKFGRKKIIVVALLMMGIATTLIGFLPTYALVGALAPVLLVALRLIQGIAIGGQSGGVILLAAESAPERLRGFFGSLASVGAPGGTLLANAFFLVFIVGLPEDALEAWGWRVPFWSSIVLVFLALYIHTKVEETDEFKRLAAEAANSAGSDEMTVARAPLFQVIRRYPKEILLTAGIYTAINLTYYILVTFVIAYGTNKEFLGLSRSVLLSAVLIAAVVQVFGLMFGGWLSDKFGRARVIALGAVTLGAFSFLLWPMINTGNFFIITLAMILSLGVFHSLMYGAQPAYFAEAFSTDVRFSGVALGMQIASVLGGAFAPTIATSLADSFGWVSIAIYMAASCVIALICVLALGETNRFRSERAETIA